MSLDPRDIQLSSDQQAWLADLSAATGKPWPEVLHEALGQYRAQPGEAQNGNGRAESFYDAVMRAGLFGCLRGGPADLSSNAAYMEGFGSGDH